ncbi:MAG: cupin, partial [Dermatophilaceae bacterium]|nr:cupin [Dermatophilaceae bacterium]
MDTTTTPYVLRADEGEALWFLGNLVTLKTTGAQTRGQLTVAEFL